MAKHKTFVIDVEPFAEKLATSLIGLLDIQIGEEVKRKLYPPYIKGDYEAGAMLGVSADAMRQRRNSGFYKEYAPLSKERREKMTAEEIEKEEEKRKGCHFYRKSARIIMWNREALLESEREKHEALRQKGQTILTV